MKTRLKFGLSQVRKEAPVWLVNLTAAIALAVVAKEYLIINIPSVGTLRKEVISEWFDYLLDVAQFILAMAVIFTGNRKEDVHDTAGDQHN